MPGLVPGIHAFLRVSKDVDGTRKSGAPDFRKVKTRPRVGNIRLAGDKPGHDAV